MSVLEGSTYLQIKFTVPASSLKLAPGLVIEITAVSLSRISVCAVKSAGVALNVISGSPATFVKVRTSVSLPSTILSSVIATGILTLVAPAGIVTVPDKTV